MKTRIRNEEECRLESGNKKSEDQNQARRRLKTRIRQEEEECKLIFRLEYEECSLESGKR